MLRLRNTTLTFPSLQNRRLNLFGYFCLICLFLMYWWPQGVISSLLIWLCARFRIIQQTSFPAFSNMIICTLLSSKEQDKEQLVSIGRIKLTILYRFLTTMPDTVLNKYYYSSWLISFTGLILESNGHISCLLQSCISYIFYLQIQINQSFFLGFLNNSRT